MQVTCTAFLKTTFSRTEDKVSTHTHQHTALAWKLARLSNRNSHDANTGHMTNRSCLQANLNLRTARRVCAHDSKTNTHNVAQPTCAKPRAKIFLMKQSQTRGFDSSRAQQRRYDSHDIVCPHAVTRIVQKCAGGFRRCGDRNMFRARQCCARATRCARTAFRNAHRIPRDT